MAPTLQELGIAHLSAEDRLALAEAIWESVAREIDQAPIPESHRQELERRLADSIARPDAVTPWGSSRHGHGSEPSRCSQRRSPGRGGSRWTRSRCFSAVQRMLPRRS